MIKRNYAKSFEGFKTRIFSKITSLTLIQYIYKFILNREIHNLKASIIQNAQRVNSIFFISLLSYISIYSDCPIFEQNSLIHLSYNF